MMQTSGTIRKHLRSLRTLKRRTIHLLEAMQLLKPVLPYVEVSLTDECNLNCRGCGFYCPIADPWYADPSRHEADMRQLRTLFRTVRQIRLMGGEPLLHPAVEQFLRTTRSTWPQADIRLVTNGILLHQMPESFWQACRDNGIAIDWTVYPPMADKLQAVTEFVADKGVPLNPRTVTTFFAHENFAGDSDPQTAFSACRERFYCPYLREGKMYVCIFPAMAHYLNRKFATAIPGDSSADLYQPGITGRTVLTRLDTPTETCRYCAYEFPEFEWGLSTGDQAEWDAPALIQAGKALVAHE